MSTADSSATADEVLTRVVNRIGFIELNRPKALNALSTGMVRAIRAALERWRDDADVLAVVMYSGNERAFCAGGDIRFLYEAYRRGDHAAVDTFFIEEYRLDHALFTWSKPYIALLRGIVMGGGMGISQAAHRTGGLRVVTGSTRMAMPETRIGLFPDVGISWFFARTPGALGRYLAVTGSTIGAADALYAGLADVYFDDDALPALLQMLETQRFETGAEMVARVSEAAAAHKVVPAPEGSSLAEAREDIDRHFSQPRIGGIVASLDAQAGGAQAEWAGRVIGAMRELSPLSMAVSLEAVTRAEGSMADCLRRDLDLTRSSFARGDVIEGIRARLIDKDNLPRWRMASVEAVSQQAVEQMFESPWPAAEHPLRDLCG